MSGSTLSVFGVLALVRAPAPTSCTSAAAPRRPTPPDDATAADITTFLDEGKQHGVADEADASEHREGGPAVPKSSAKAQVPLAGLHTNPFRMEVPNRRPQRMKPKPQPRRRRDEERAAVVEAAKGLRLQLIMYGEKKVAS